MPIERHVLRSAALAATLLVSAPAFAANEPYGVWMNDTGRGAIEIKDCGGKLCGHVVWVKDTNDAKGCGRQIIGDAASSGGVWGGNGAWIYSPEKKKNYSVEITPLADGTLKVMGYAGIKFLSKTMIWTKAPADLARCTPEQTATATPAPGTNTAPPPATAEGSKSAAEQAPADKAAPPADEKNVAENEKKGGNLEGLASEFGDVFTKKDGKCKVDTPWVKLDFDCKDEK
ncbi:DUF2147 domain-containing protein [Hyphomicrobium sp.]|uniref:DUF2147 domain-containing protein n=1 Tax=Hyphomicrobium sp. TaxID=82 RepID=UPI002E350572|nr:DUF2147 domain-containing protein [Hyphomicrobium sp.]HEX2840179.1 DUF2147 domain-containing protein [Hyphomicrobium sp.]